MALYLIADTETGGLNPNEADLLQAGFVLTDTKMNELWSYEFPIHKVEYRANPGALAVNRLDLEVLRKTGVYDCSATDTGSDGYTPENYKAQIALKTMRTQLEQIKKDGVEIRLMCHNVIFDRPFLFREFTWLPSVLSYRTVDTIGVALALQDAGVLKVPNVKLETLTSHFKIEHTGAHTALADAQACRLVYKKFLELIKK